MMAMGFKCDCGYKTHSRFYIKYEIRDGEKVYLGHPGDGFAINAIEENPYIHTETNVIKWFEKGSEVPDKYKRHFVEMILYGDEEQKKSNIPYCPECKKELELDAFIGCM